MSDHPQELEPCNVCLFKIEVETIFGGFMVTPTPRRPRNEC